MKISKMVDYLPYFPSILQSAVGMNTTKVHGEKYSLLKKMNNGISNP